MPVEQIVQLALVLIQVLGPEVVKLADEAIHGGDVVGTLSQERIEAILGETSHLELAEHAARLAAAHDSVQLAPVQRKVVNTALAMAHQFNLVTL